MNEYTNAAGIYVAFPFFTRDVLGNIGASTHINYSHLEPILSQETVDRLEQDCLNIVKVYKKTAFRSLYLLRRRKEPFNLSYT